MLAAEPSTPIDVGAVLVGDLAQPACRLADRFLHRDVARLVVGGEHRPPDPLRRVPLREAVAAAVAEPHVVDLRVVARREAAHLEVAAVDVDVAAVRALGADARRALQVPRARDEAVLTVRQRADRADLGKVALELRLQLLVVEGGDERVDAALLEHDLLLAGDLVVVANAAPAEDAALLVELDVLRERDRLLEVDLLGDRKARDARAVAEREVLEVALAAAVAHRAVERVVEQQELEHPLAQLGDLGDVGADHHSLVRDRRARRLRLGELLDVDQAHAADGDRLHLRMRAVDGDVDAELGRGVEHQRALRDTGFAPVDADADAAVVRLLGRRARRVRHRGHATSAAACALTGHRPAPQCASNSSRKDLYADMTNQVAVSPSGQKQRPSMFEQMSARLASSASVATTRLEPMHQLRLEVRALTAGNALAARLVAVEVDEPHRDVDEAGRLVHEDHRAGAERRPGLLHLVHVERQIEMLRAGAPASIRRPAGMP